MASSRIDCAKPDWRGGRKFEVAQSYPLMEFRLLLFDLPYAVARSRISTLRTMDRFEQEQAEFHERVRLCYLELAAAAPIRFRTIDATGSHDQINKLLEEIFSTI